MSDAADVRAQGSSSQRGFQRPPRHLSYHATLLLPPGSARMLGFRRLTLYENMLPGRWSSCKNWSLRQTLLWALGYNARQIGIGLSHLKSASSWSPHLGKSMANNPITPRESGLDPLFEDAEVTALRTCSKNWDSLGRGEAPLWEQMSLGGHEGPTPRK